METKRLVEQVKRNLERFPEDFMFQLSRDEAAALRSQIATSNVGRGGRRYAPYVFTEQGVAMLSGVLRSKRAIAVNIEIMRAFVELRRDASSYTAIEKRLEQIELEIGARLSEHDERLEPDLQSAAGVDGAAAPTEAAGRIQAAGGRLLVGSLGKNRLISEGKASTTDGDAAAVAAAKVAAVRDDPTERLALASSTYKGPTGDAPRHLPFRRAAMSFMRWEAQRGVLNALDAEPPGSRWWRAMNERLLRDGCEAVERAGGRGGRGSTPMIELWDAFVEKPTARTWYRAHNASIVAAYLDHRDLAEKESRTERFFLNVVLARVLYAHALVAAPRLALGRMALCGRPLGDPRLGMAGVFLSMGRVLPNRYPVDDALEVYLRAEHTFGRILDYAVIQPRLHRLYDWSASELGRPEISDLVVDGTPAYAWSPDERKEWEPPPLSVTARAMKIATAPR